MTRSKIYEALLVITTALIVFYLFGWLKHGASHVVYLYVAAGVGISGILVRPFGRIIAMGWYKLADLLGGIMSKILMALVFMVILVPMALLYRLSKKDRLHLRRKKRSLWIDREHQYHSNDLDKLW